MKFDSHTPGPWVRHTIENYVYAPNESGPLAKVDRDVGYAGFLVAETLRNRHDAHIIAAAPDLLAACIEAAEEDVGLRAFPALIKAIVKAHGGKLPPEMRDNRAAREAAGLDPDGEG